jgi:hypothetical protein
MHFQPNTLCTAVTRVKIIYPIITLTLHPRHVTQLRLNLHGHTVTSKGPFSQRSGLMDRWLGSVTEAGEIKRSLCKTVEILYT